MLAEGLIVANPMRDLVGSVGRAELGRGAAARGGDIGIVLNCVVSFRGARRAPSGPLLPPVSARWSSLNARVRLVVTSVRFLGAKEDRFLENF